MILELKAAFGLSNTEARGEFAVSRSGFLANPTFPMESLEWTVSIGPLSNGWYSWIESMAIDRLHSIHTMN